MSLLIKTQATIWLLAILCLSCFGQEPSTENLASEPPSDAHTIILSPAHAKPPAFLYAANSKSEVMVGATSIEQNIQIQVRIVQGEGETVSLALNGSGEVIAVEGETMTSWAVRTADSQRFLDLHFKPNSGDPSVVVRIRSIHDRLPARVQLAHLGPGKALGFDSQIQVSYSSEVEGKVVVADGFAPLVSGNKVDRFQSSTGGRMELNLERPSTLPPPLELVDTSLIGNVHPSGKSATFAWRSEVQVHAAGMRLRAISGHVAIEKLPESADFRLELMNTDAGPAYELYFPKPGKYSVALDFVAPLKAPNANWQGLDFIVAASSVVPVVLKGLEAEIEFAREPHTMVPTLMDKEWRGFLPATGHVSLRWQNARRELESKTFFATTAIIESVVGPGLLRQEHRIAYQMLQGRLESLAIKLDGPGEILNVDGEHIVGWKVVGEATERRLEITLNQPLEGNGRIVIRSQTPLGTFPVRVKGLSLQPIGAIRSSGHIRIASSGSVNVQPMELRGLTQLAPEQFPNDHEANDKKPDQTQATNAPPRQLFVFRFPSADYGFTIEADRVQPEVNITQLVLYQISESDRVILADVELDIREASIREWNLRVPEDYSIVSVTGASVADYAASTEVQDGLRNLKILFGQDIQGRQLIGLRLEKNEVAATGEWTLPSIQYPEAKAIRGDIGVVAAPGFRATVGTTELLVEKPLSYFPKPIPNLQQAFRIREPGWKATMQIEQLERSIQSDVFHLYSLGQGAVYGSVLINYTVTGAPVSEWQLALPASYGNVTVDGQEIRTWRREGDLLIVSLQQPVLGGYTLLITFEEKPKEIDGSFEAGLVSPLGIQSDRGYVEVVSPIQVEIDPQVVSTQLLALDPLELPAEFRLLSTAPPLGTWQYTQRPFELRLKVKWFDPGTTAAQVVEFSEANSRVSPDGELVTDLLYYVKSRGQRTLKLRLPEDPVRLWAASVNGRPTTARQSGEDTLIPLPTTADPNQPMEVRLRLGKPAEAKESASLVLPVVFAPVLKTQWNIQGDENHILIPSGGNVEPTIPVLWPNGFNWLSGRGLVPAAILTLLVFVVFLLSQAAGLGALLRTMALIASMVIAIGASMDAFQHWSSPAPLQLSLPVLASGESVNLMVLNIPNWKAYTTGVGIVLLAAGLVGLLISWRMADSLAQRLLRWAGFGAIVIGVLLQPNGGPLFFAVVALAILVFQFVPTAIQGLRRWTSRRSRSSNSDAVNKDSTNGGDASAIATVLIVLGIATATLISADPSALADEPTVKNLTAASSGELERTRTASSMIQQWKISGTDFRLSASATVSFVGLPGDSFVLLRAPGVLTQFEGSGLRLEKRSNSPTDVTYIVTIESTKEEQSSPKEESNERETETEIRSKEPKQYAASFEYQLDAIQPTNGIPVLTGNAALQQIDLRYNQVTWEVSCESAARIEAIDKDDASGQANSVGESANGQSQPEDSSERRMRILLGPGPALIFMKPQTRDLAAEETQFFVEGYGLYTPGPGVIDGRHRFSIRAAQGRISRLSVGSDGKLGRWTDSLMAI